MSGHQQGKGVSGAAQAAPDLNGLFRPASAGETKGQFGVPSSSSKVSSDKQASPDRSTQIRIRVPLSFKKKLEIYHPKLRSRVVAALLVSTFHDIDPEKLAAAVDELRRLGILLTHALRLYYQGHSPVLDAEPIEAALAFIEELRD